jgi:hypothetical protein
MRRSLHCGACRPQADLDCTPMETPMPLSRTHTLLAALATACCLPASLHAAEPSAAEVDLATRWAQAGDSDKDHLLSKAEVLALVEKAFADADARKAGKLDMKQVAMMLREFDPRASGVKPSGNKP